MDIIAQCCCAISQRPSTHQRNNSFVTSKFSCQKFQIGLYNLRLIAPLDDDRKKWTFLYRRSIPSILQLNSSDSWCQLLILRGDKVPWKKMSGERSLYTWSQTATFYVASKEKAVCKNKIPRMENSSMDPVDVGDATKFWGHSREHPYKQRDFSRPIASQWDQEFHGTLKVIVVNNRFFDEATPSF